MCKNKTSPSLSYEQAIKELEDIVLQMESGDIPLEQSMSLFEKGVSLSKQCHVQLQQTEQKINALIKDLNDNFDSDKQATLEEE